MNKFNGILLCTDLDDTLLTKDKRVCERNLEAIDYFKKEGGLFTFTTGRVPLGAMPVLEYVMPNAPAVCFNGAGIYDFSLKKLLWSRALDRSAAEVIEFVDKAFPDAGIEVCTAGRVCFCKKNHLTEKHKKTERFSDDYPHWNDVKEDWNKVIFMVEEAEMPALKKAILGSPFAEKYAFVRSSPWYYELLPKGVSKGEGLLKLSSLLNIDISHVIAMGDNENDLELIKRAGTGIAVSNAIDEVREAADYITHADNNTGAVAEVIELIK